MKKIFIHYPSRLRQGFGGQVSIIHKKGFTLLELLVVISIIGILVAIGSASYSTVQKKGRDARRKEDLKAIQNALEQSYSVNSAYPGGTYPNGISTYMSTAVPTDPKNASAYCATTYSTTSYTICTDLETDTFTGNCTDNDFCVSALQ